jgi:uncharacterized membrane protein
VKYWYHLRSQNDSVSSICEWVSNALACALKFVGGANEVDYVITSKYIETSRHPTTPTTSVPSGRRLRDHDIFLLVPQLPPLQHSTIVCLSDHRSLVIVWDQNHNYLNMTTSISKRFVACFLCISGFSVVNGFVQRPTPNHFARFATNLVGTRTLCASDMIHSSDAKKLTTNVAPVFPKYVQELKAFGFFEQIQKRIYRLWAMWRFAAQSITRNLSRYIRRAIATITVLVMVHMAMLPPSFAAGSSGRMGGSFGTSGRSGGHGTTRVYSSHSRPSFPSSPWIRGSTRGPSYDVLPLYYRHHNYQHRHANSHQQKETTTTVVHPNGATTVVRKETRGSGHILFSVSDVIILTGAASWVAYQVSKQYQDGANGEGGTVSPLGPGFSVLSLTACLHVPDRNDDNSILQRLAHLAQTNDTSNRKGLQNLMAETSLELARQQNAIISAESHYDHMRSATQAERQYNLLSTQHRSKFDRESLSNYGGKRSEVDSREMSSLSPVSSATVALVTIHLAIEGDSLRSFDNIKSRKVLKDALTRISSDVQCKDCLLAAEVIWSPEEPTDLMTMEDIYVDFPSLYTLLD